MDDLSRKCQKLILDSTDCTVTEKTLLIEAIFKVRLENINNDEEYDKVYDKFREFREKVDDDAFSPAYKKFNQADKFLERLWSIFPTLEYLKNSEITNKQLTNMLEGFLIDHVRTDSAEFCKLLSDNKIKSTEFASGGFGTVGELMINEDEKEQDVKAVIISIKRRGGFEPFYCPVIIKSSKQPTEITWTGESGPDGTRIIIIQDPITEMVFGTMLGHFYDMGICPFYSKYFGMFSCPDTTNGKDRFHFITEKSNVEIGDLLKYRKFNTKKGWVENPLFKPIRDEPEILLNILFQFIYAIYVGKTKIGFTHYDTHQRNVMITYTDDRLFDEAQMGTKPVDYIYQGRDMRDIQYIIYDTGIPVTNTATPQLIVTKYNGLMAKMIDYGACAAFMNTPSEESEYKRPYTFVTAPGNLRSMGGGFDAYERTKTSASARNTQELQYLLTNIHENMDKGLNVWDPTDGTPTQAESQSIYSLLLDTLETFTAEFYNNDGLGIDTWLRNNPQLGAFVRPLKRNPKTGVLGRDRTAVGEGGWHPIPTRTNAGIGEFESFDDPRALMFGLARYCHSLGHRQSVQFNPLNNDGRRGSSVLYYLEKEIGNEINDLSPDNCLILSANPSKSAISKNSFYKNYKNIDNLATKCEFTIPEDLGDKPWMRHWMDQMKTSAGCAKAFDKVLRLQTGSTLEKPLYNPLINAPGYDKTKGEIKDGVILDGKNFPKTIRVIDDGKNLRIYSLQINPEALRMKRNGQSSLVYKSYQNWLDYNDIPTEKDGSYLETVNLNVITITPKTEHVIKLNHGKDLWTANNKLTDYPTAITVNGGYFIVGANKNMLTTNMVTEEDMGRPIGFYYDKTRKDNGTYLPIPKPYRPYFGVISCKDNKISIEYHEQFTKKHETISSVIQYMLDDGEIYSTTHPVIKMTNGSARGIAPVLKDGSTADYDWAFCSGPMLVANGKVVFNFDTMFTKQFTINDSDQPSVIGAKKPPNNTTYKLLPGALNNFMFKSASKLDTASAYGSRHSNRMMIHNVMGITKSGVVMFFMIEGRGYDAPGLDRVQVANLVKKFNIETAISLDGGFSANAVYKTDGEQQKWLQNDPEKRDLGISISFAFMAPTPPAQPKKSSLQAALARP